MKTKHVLVGGAILLIGTIGLVIWTAMSPIDYPIAEENAIIESTGSSLDESLMKFNSKQ